MFYEDQNVVKGLQEQFAAYADNFPIWSEHSTAIAQFAVWNILTEQGIGASLQHYNPIIDEKINVLFNIPSEWKLRAQLVLVLLKLKLVKKPLLMMKVVLKHSDNSF